MKHTGGTWDRDANNVYFIAGDVGTLTQGSLSNHHLLIAVNELGGDDDLEAVKSWTAAGKTVFIDSGVFNLTMEHVRKNGVRMDEALAMAPDLIDGFDKLFERYCRLISDLKDDVWGYIEIDQGGRENKKKTRAKLESMGYAPIPVYHPLNDGWDYFDELAQNYDRICLGNIVQADQETRRALLATLWERRRKYPHLWIHALGLTPNEQLNAFPIDSSDSSTWLAGVRWGASSTKDRIALSSYSNLPPGFSYDYFADADHPTGHFKARQLGGYLSHFITKNWQGLRSEYEALGLDPGLYDQRLSA